MTALLHLVESSLENMAAECSAQRMHELHAQCETSLLELDRAGARGQAEYFVGMFHFWHGHFREALAAFEVALQYPQLWECRFQTEMFSLYTSSSAVYLGRFHQAVASSRRPKGRRSSARTVSRSCGGKGSWRWCPVHAEA